jgi:ADP-dependent NAD(P)H-hydrate dehydratase / NAD(P)H-hydrate epimerase
MKILSTDQIRSADKYTAEAEGISSWDLMERASNACFAWISSCFPPEGFKGRFLVFCGTGNNGGDGLAIARMLLKSGYRTEVYVAGPLVKATPDFSTNLSLFEKQQPVNRVETRSQLPPLVEGDVVIDALLGSGLSRPLDGILSDAVYHINTFKAEGTCTVIAVDLPTGLFADKTSVNSRYVVNADYTLTFELPRLALLLPENAGYAGVWHVLPVGLSSEYIEKQPVRFFYVEKGLVASLLRPRQKFSHKGTYGHALLVAGSYGKAGAAALAAKGALRAGAGLLTCYVPRCVLSVLQAGIHEAMVLADPGENYLTDGLRSLDRYSAIGIGPGIGTGEDTSRALKAFLQTSPVPLVLDADALNILSENKTWLHFLPPNSILTPHPGEFERLAGRWGDDFERLQLQISFSLKYKVYLLLKGAHSSLSCPDGTCFFNSSGNPGMATGGSGDLLTGIITGLLAQGYSSLEAALTGMFVHGLAGDIAAEERGEDALLPSDMADCIGKAFLSIRQSSY